ncbi:MAG: extracellular solute-binding protein [Paenibacillaceae bacterium]|nr:extracellular solute-binding protein [Paenibacillaceae bacterium]
MKKIVPFTLATLLVSSALLGACGKDDGGAQNNGSAAPAGSPGAGTTAKPKEPVKLRFWGGVPPESGPQTVIDKWNQANKDIQVEYIRFVNDEQGNTKLDTALLSTNDAPDLYVSYSAANVDRRTKAGMAEPLEDLMAKVNFNVEEVIGTSNIMKSNGKIHYLPAAVSPQIVLFNKASLDAVGEKVPTTGWTWDDFAALAKKMNKPGQYGAFFIPGWEPIAYDMSITAKPTDVYYGDDGLSTFTSLPSFNKGLELHKSLIDSKVTYPYAEAATNKLQPQDELLNGKAAMVFTGTYLIRYIKDDKAYPNRNYQISFAPIPQYERGTKVNSGGPGDFMSINPKSANKEATMKFLSWYLNEGNQDMIPGGRIPSNKKADMNKIADQLIGDAGKYFDKESLVNTLKADVTYRVFSKTTAQPEIRKAFMEEAEKVFLNAQPVDKALENMKKRADEAIKAAK